MIIGFLLVAGYKEISSSLPDLVDKTLEEEYQIVIIRELTAMFDRYNAFYGPVTQVGKPHLYRDLAGIRT